MRRLLSFQVIRPIIFLRLPLELRSQRTYITPNRVQSIVQLTHHAIQLGDELLHVRNLLFNGGQTIVHAGIVTADERISRRQGTF